MARDMIPVDFESLSAARKKMRTVIRQLEEGRRPHDDDILHPAYKLSQFLSDALGPAWDAAEERAPDVLPDERPAALTPYKLITYAEAFRCNLVLGGVARLDSDGVWRAYHQGTQTYWPTPSSDTGTEG